MKILAVSGSLRPQSSNTAILQAVVELASDAIDVHIYDGISHLPYFNPDLDREDALAPVLNWRRQLQNTDGIIFCTPEYAHGIPGVLKNALDWVVSSGEFMHKPTAVISASPSSTGGDKANASLVQTLQVMMADIPTGSVLCIPTISAKFNNHRKLTDPAISVALRSLLDALAHSIHQKFAN
jgi:chromate reductase, NAD(P)H dehydrogenase (quinone)